MSRIVPRIAAGKVATSGPINDGEDLADARKQLEAVAKAKKSLTSAVEQAEQASGGYRTVGVTPSESLE